MYEDFILNYNFVVDPLDKDADSLKINTTTKDWYYFYDTANTNVFVTPALQPTNLIMPSPEIVRTNNVINKRTKWVFSFKINKNSVPKGGYIIIKIPKDVLLTIPDSKIDVTSYETNRLYNFNYIESSDKLSIT